MRRSSLYLTPILGLALGVACANEPTLPQPGVQASLTGSSATIVSCAPLGASSASALIGPLGGTITVGPHTFMVPAGALTEDVLITATTGGEPVNAVHFQPEGLQFLTPATLTMSYANCGQWGQLKRFQMVYADESYTVREVLPTVTNSVNKSITSSLNHFSIYAVAE